SAPATPPTPPTPVAPAPPAPVARAAQPTPAPAVARTQAPPPKASPTAAMDALGEFDTTGIKRVAMTKIRKKIAERLITAQQTAAILTTFNEVDLHNLQDIRARYKEKFEKLHGVGLGLMSFFCRAVVLGLKEFP